MLIDGYPEGSDISIIDITYVKSEKKEVIYSNGYMRDTWTKDYLIIVYRDNVTQQKKHQIIEEPEYTYYISNENDIKPYPRYFVSKDNVHPVTTKYKDLEKSIFMNLGMKEEYNILKANSDFKGIKNIHKDPRVFMSDMNIEDYYRFLFSNEYPNNNFKIHKAFFDIEVDGKYQAGDFPELGEVPINAVSLYDDKLNKVFTFLLRNKENPLIEEFEHNISEKVLKDMYDFIVDAVGGRKKAESFGMTGLQLELIFFDEEIDLVHSLFATIHKISPDFCLGYNMSNFDMAYIIQRVINLGYDPTDILCDNNFPKKYRHINHFIDINNKNQLNKRSDYTNISGHVVFVDQLLQFAQKRSAKYGSFDSFKLDDIGYLVAKVKKLSYAHITHDITQLPYLNYYIFVLYNIIDTVVQHCIEIKSKDVEYLYSKCAMNNTSYGKCHRQTVYLMNRFAKEYYKSGYILGNNMNRDNEKPEKYAGAIVGDPTLLNDFSKLKINGLPSMIVDNTIDEDFKSLYPSCTNQCNMAPNTQIGQIEIAEPVWSGENILKDEKYCRASEFVENLVCDNILIFANRYFNLATFKEFIADLKEYCELNNLNFEKEFRTWIGFIPFESNVRIDGKVDPFIEVDSGKTDPFIIENSDDEKLIFRQIIRGAI